MSNMGYLAATDWAKITAEATVWLAVVTAVLAAAAIVAAVFTWRGLRTAAEDLRATQDATTVAQEMAQRQIEASYRPLLIDVPPYGPIDPNDPLVSADDSPRIRLDFPGGHTDFADPRQIYVHLSGPRANIAIPLRNVGQGLAVVDPALVSVFGQRIGEMEPPVVQRKRIPPGEITRILCTPRLVSPGLGVATYPWVLEVRVQYSDFIGGQGAVVVVYLEQQFSDAEWLLKDVEQIPPDEAIPLRPRGRPSTRVRRDRGA
jgi:hypothetical protein